MKKAIMASVFLALSAVIPAIPSVMGNTEKEALAKSQDIAVKEYIFDECDSAADEPYKVLNCSTGIVSEVSVRDYVIGAVAAEMPASFEEEALKAQAVAAHTYAERQRGLQKKSPDTALGNADFSDDPNKYQGFYTNDMIHHYFGENYDVYYKKIAKAVDEVLPYIMTYEDEPIIAAFHSMSSGRTESAENVWGAAVDYLVSTDSEADTEAPGYIEETEIDEQFVKTRLERVFEGIKLENDPEKWITIKEKSPSGTVIKAEAGGIEVTGGEIREAFGLRSADFTVSCKDGKIIFTTRGYGHGVGMSQYGANHMAQQGSTWREILEHYYSKTEIVSMC